MIFWLLKVRNLGGGDLKLGDSAYTHKKLGKTLRPISKIWNLAFVETTRFLIIIRSIRMPSFNLKQVESVTKSVGIKVSFRLNKWLNEYEYYIDR